MTEKPLSLSEVDGPIDQLYESDCTAVVVLTTQKDGKSVNGAAFTFLEVAQTWYRLSYFDRSMSCRPGDRPSSPTYGATGDGYSYKQTDLSALFLSERTRITDIYLKQGFNYTRAVLCFTNARSLQLRNYWDSGRTLLSIV